jgi:hypothetical protein
MGGRAFVKFHLDVGIGDVVLDRLNRHICATGSGSRALCRQPFR